MKNINLENILLKPNNTYKTCLLGDLVKINKKPKENKNKCKKNREYEIWGVGINPKGLNMNITFLKIP